MKYKAIKSAVHNFGDSFASSLNWAVDDYAMSHLARRALADGQTEMIVDLLTGEASPAELVRPPVQGSIDAKVSWFPTLLASQRIDPADCWVEVVDDHDRTHAAHFRRWWPFTVDGPELGMPRSPDGGRGLRSAVSRAGRRLASTWTTRKGQHDGG